MVKCALCSEEYKDRRGLMTHVKAQHGMIWDKYNELYPQENPKPQTQLETAGGGDGNGEVELEGKGDVVEVKPESSLQLIPDERSQQLEERMGSLEKQMGGVAETMNKFLNMLNPGSPQEEDKGQLPKGAVPFEDVELTGDTYLYKIRVNPEIFYWWNVFKAQNKRLSEAGKAKPFMGDFSDFVDLAIHTLLGVFKIYPTVIHGGEGKMLVEIPSMEEG